MTSLRQDSNKLARAKGVLASIISEIDSLSSDKALQFCEWLLVKAKFFRQHNNKVPFGKLPINMKRGDIVWVRFGINVGDEFGDDGTKGHYALVWARQGFMFVVIPLSSQPRKDDFTVELGKIDELPDNVSFAKLDNIKSISIRRIGWINGLKDGKITINDPLINKIKVAIKKVFLN